MTICAASMSVFTHSAFAQENELKSINGIEKRASFSMDNVTLISQLTFPGNAVRVYVSGQRAYVTSTDKTLRIIDISDPVQPEVISTFNTTGFARGVIVVDTLAYLVDGVNLQVLNVSNPSIPLKIAELNSLGQPWDLTISGNYAYVVDAYGNPGLNIVDITNPLLPEHVGFVSLAGSAWTVSVSGDYAYVANFLAGLRIIDIRNPISPQIVGTYDTDCFAYSVVTFDNPVYVGDAFCGLLIIDVSIPTSPTLLGSQSTSGLAWHATASGNLLYVASGTDGGLRVFDLSNPVIPTLAGYYDTPGTAYGVYVANDYIYLADLTGGFLILQYTGPTSVEDFLSSEQNFILAQNYPNPFNPVTTIEYTLPKSGEVSMIVYNLLGQEVTRIIDEVQQSGYHKVTWDASNFSSGIYFYRLQVGPPAGGIRPDEEDVVVEVRVAKRADSEMYMNILL